jgi:hypothetical protein
MPSVNTRGGGWLKVECWRKSYSEVLNQTTLEVAEMTVDAIILKLTPEDALRLTRILLDDDKEEALLFLKQCLKPQLDQRTRGRMVRSFEAL